MHKNVIIKYGNKQGGENVILKAARVNGGLTQPEMAKAIGVCRNVYIAFEKGNKPMTEEQARAFSKACGCKLSELDCKVLVLVEASTLC